MWELKAKTRPLCQEHRPAFWSACIHNSMNYNMTGKQQVAWRILLPMTALNGCTDRNSPSQKNSSWWKVKPFSLQNWSSFLFGTFQKQTTTFFKALLTNFNFEYKFLTSRFRSFHIYYCQTKTWRRNKNTRKNETKTPERKYLGLDTKQYIKVNKFKICSMFSCMFSSSFSVKSSHHIHATDLCRIWWMTITVEAQHILLKSKRSKEMR